MLSSEWRKSTKSAESNTCVEVRAIGATVEVRDSKDPNGPVLVFTPPEWEAFIGGAKASEFEL